ncbi:putative nicotinate-nucleotide adenylyltransferase [Methyloligella halotolerans]|uniref:Probable nicotinate-nucleotide adenylyltransferase n=2 Tax=Methyloligella halotolerans TaxID=1177755 RepID=A0A1E2S1D1_9HYPH|nr:putative nicotinate-nucleotide adenylyltransferase [Methyloligella halotolerans]
MRIGLLGGSFNPAHEAHRHITLAALKRLQLDQVWWLVTPGNPLKTPTGPSIEERVASAEAVARHPRIKVTDFEKGQGSPYTADTLRTLKRLYPETNFVWLMGADNMADIHRWKDWHAIFETMPVAVFDRPGFRMKARAGKAAQVFARRFVDPSDAAGLALMRPPAWTLVTLPLSSLSSTEIRENGSTD